MRVLTYLNRLRQATALISRFDRSNGIWFTFQLGREMLCNEAAKTLEWFIDVSNVSVLSLALTVPSTTFNNTVDACERTKEK